MPDDTKVTYTERKKERMYAKLDQWQGRIAGALVILVLCLQPLYVDWNGYLRLTYIKYTFFVIYMAIILTAVAVVWIYRAAAKPRLGPRGALTLPDAAAIAFAIVTVVSAIFSPFKDETNVWVGMAERYDGAITQFLYVAIYFVVSRWYSPKKRHFTLFGISALLIGIIGILQFYGYDFLHLWPKDRYDFRVDNFYNIYFRSTLGNVDIVSTYVCVAILLCGMLFIRGDAGAKNLSATAQGSTATPTPNPTSNPASTTPAPATATNNTTKKRITYFAGLGLVDLSREKVVYYLRQTLFLVASALNFWLMEMAGADSGRVGVAVAMVLAIPFIIDGRKTIGRFFILGASWLATYTLQKLLYDVNILAKQTPDSLNLYLAAIGIALAIGLTLVMWGKERDPEKPVRWVTGLIAMVLCIGIGVVGINELGRREGEANKTHSMIYQVHEILNGRIEDYYGTYRVYVWRNALRALPNNPVLGSGPDTFFQAFPEEAQGYYREVYDKAHNEFVQILICQGIMGLVFYLLFLGGAFAAAIKKVYRNPAVIAVIVAFIGYNIQAFFNISVPIASQMLWVFAGLMVNKSFIETHVTEPR